MAKINIQRVLVAPLDWGLGHATRCIPIIKALLQHQYSVFVACNATQQSLLEKEFSNIQFIELDGYNIQYTKQKWWFPFKMVLQVNRIYKTIKKEHIWLQNIIETYQIDLVISDNRYGLHSTKIPCVFITHQLLVKAPFHWLELCIQKQLYKYIQQFSSVWVPDFASENQIAGKLSHPTQKPTIPIHYIGILSRFDVIKNATNLYRYCIIISGPEPQRTLLEEIIFKQIQNTIQPIVFVRGLPKATNVLSTNNSNITIYNHLDGASLNALIQSSEFIVCRSGYTTIMELLHLQKKAILIATPGQTEQEYLAQLLHEKKYAVCIPQNRFNFQKVTDLANAFVYKTPDASFSQQVLSNQIHFLIQQL